MSRPGARLLSDDGPVRLGERIGRGGEGEVFAVAERPDLAAKLYRPEIAGERAGKIAAMVAAGLGDAMALVAFPVAELRTHDGRFAGFLMPKVAAAEPIHELYAPGARKRTFPEADYRFLVRAALNAARAVAAAHRSGCVIGDVNHSGFLITEDALVSLIDADSFQFDEGATRHLCRVGVPEYMPPELQGVSLAGVERSADHDVFGLAVLLFQLLFLGRHPYAGVSKTEEDVSVEEAIAAHAFAYARRKPRGAPLKPPPGALRLDEVPPQAAALFERAFARDAAGARPTAEDWVAALSAFEAALVACPKSKRHFHASGGAGCPWCRLERRSRTKLFPAPGEPGAAPRAPDKAPLVARFEAIALPDRFAYAPPEPLPSSEPPPPSPKQVWFERAYLTMLTGMMGCAIGLIVVTQQAILMCMPILIYGYGRVGDAVFPRRGRRRALSRLDRKLEIEIGHAQDRAELDTAWLLRADIARRLSRGKKADLSRVARDLPKLEALAASLRDGATARTPEVEGLLARRAKLAREMAAAGDPVAAPPSVPPRGLRPATRDRVARLAAV